MIASLRWLISRQGYKRGGQAIVAWSTSGKKIPDPLENTFNLMGLELPESDSKPSVSTSQDFATKLNKKIAGYKAELGDTNKIVVMGLESAEPNKGRLAITYYREITNSDFLERIEKWHQTCSWIHNYGQKEIINHQTGKKQKIHFRFTGAPSPEDIAKSVYGSRIDDKLLKSTVERILPCIIDGQKIPRDLVDLIVYRASNRVGMDDWEWKKTLSIACALYKKYKDDYEKEVFDMSLDVNRKTRDYLYGRLLALADSLEQWALKEAGESRQTTAARYMHRFAERPFSTWRIIELSLEPYKARLGKKSSNIQKMISEVMTLFNPDDFMSDKKKLSGEFLLGYHCQREALWKEKNKSTNENELINEIGE